MKCPKCSKSIQSGNSQCPHCGREIALLERVPIALGAVFVAAFGLLVVFAGRAALQNIDYGEGEEVALYSQEWADEQWIAAYLACQDAVKDRLKAPATAEFPFSEDHTTYLGEGKFSVESWVDAENEFGAQIRSRWSCTVFYEGGDKWRTSEVGVQ